MTEYQRGRREALLEAAELFFEDSRKLHKTLDKLWKGPLRERWSEPELISHINQNRARANEMTRVGERLEALAQVGEPTPEEPHE